jgi:NADH-quinone oxidoreductase subunit H
MFAAIVTFLTTHWLGQAILILLECLAVTVPLLVAVAYMTYVDRKVWASIQLRRGPNVVGPFGLLQPFADGLKLVLKETIIPVQRQQRAVHHCADDHLHDRAGRLGGGAVRRRLGDRRHQCRNPLSLRHLLDRRLRHHHRRLGVQLEYAFLGALRSAAQMVSYEVSIGFVLITVLLCVGSLNLSQGRAGPVGLVLELVLAAAAADVRDLLRLGAGRDQPHAVRPADVGSRAGAGFHTEYSAMTFGLFFLGEYANMILLSAMGAVLFLGGWMSPIPYAPFTWVPGVVWFCLKIAMLLFVFSWTKGTLPRYRYDQLMRLGWKVFLPVSLGWVVLTAAVLQFGGWVPKH